MLQLRVNVKRLNKRRQIPVHFPDRDNIIGEVFEGFVFEGEEVDPKDIPNKDLGKWYKDRGGNFYWGGGVRELIIVTSPTPSVTALPEGIVQFDSNKMSWAHKFYDIPFIWNDLRTKGKGVTVAVIDTGIDIAHSDLIPNIHPLSKSFFGDEKLITDINGHGTCMAGIIAGAGQNKVYGVAPEAKLLILRATPQKSEANFKAFATAVNFATSLPEVDIISISYSFVIDDAEFKKAIQNAVQSNKIVVSAIGNAHDFTSTDKPDDDTFPASYNDVENNKNGAIAVGAFDSSGQLCSFSNWNMHLRCLAPGQSILTTKTGNDSGTDTGTSIATAFAAGCLALMLSHLKAKALKKNCLELLLDTCDDVGPQIGFDIKNGHGIINLRNAISKIK